MASAEGVSSRRAQPLQVGLIGHGAIGTYVVQRLLDGVTLPQARLSAVLVQRERAEVPQEFSGTDVLFTSDPEEFFSRQWDVAVEAAGQSAVRDFGPRCLGLGRRFLLTSVGALCDEGLHGELLSAAEANNSQLLIAAGAMPGMDWMSSAAFEHVDEVTITQTKRPEGWFGTPAEDSVDLKSLTSPVTFFRGSAREAATQFPKNANISAALGLATCGLDRATVELVADPGVVGPKNQVRLVGAAGELTVEVKGKPAAGSQRTSMIVPLSVVKALRNLSAPQFVGL